MDARRGLGSRMRKDVWMWAGNRERTGPRMILASLLGLRRRLILLTLPNHTRISRSLLRPRAQIDSHRGYVL